MKTMTYCRIARWAATVAAVSLALPLCAERQPFERYQSVVDRQMFGQPPPGFDPTKPASEVSAKDEMAKEQALTQEQEQVKSAIHFSMVNVTPSGETAVGFTDNSDAKNPKHYYLKAGESRDGWTVKEADALKASMTIAKGEIEVSLELGGNSASGAGSTARAGGGAQKAFGGNSFGNRPNMSRMGGMNGGVNRGVGSLRERRLLREQQRAEDAKAAAEKEALREQERAAERARQEQEKAEREKEREEQRSQLMQIQEELRKAREERAKAEEQQKAAEAPKEGNNES